MIAGRRVEISAGISEYGNFAGKRGVVTGRHPGSRTWWRVMVPQEGSVFVREAHLKEVGSVGMKERCKMRLSLGS